MALVPNGRVKVMQAQSVRDFGGLKEIFAQMARTDVTQQEVGVGGQQAPSPGGTNPAGASPAAPEPGTQPTGTPGMTPGVEGQPTNAQPGGDAAGQAFDLGQQGAPVDDQKFQNSLTKFVLQKVIQWKWPERLAVTKQEEMIDEKITADGHRNFTIVVPNIYYGGDVVSNQDFQQFIQELTQKFGIHFQSAQRKGKKATLQFSTTQKEMHIDPLQEIYGKGSGSAPAGAGSKKAAFTMGEILTARRENLYETMRKIACQETK